MNRSGDPAFEIRAALDREVRRTFDPARLAAALEDDPARVAEPRPETSRGPFGRVPAAVQWVGIVAAVIAAATGLRSLYLELSAREPTVLERSSGGPSTGPGEPGSSPAAGQSEAPEPSPPPARVFVAQPEAEPPPPPPSPQPRSEPEPIEAASADAAPAPVARTDPDAAGRSAATVPQKPRSRSGAAPEVLARPSPTSVPPATPQPSASGGGVMVTFPGPASEPGVGGVQVASLRLDGGAALLSEVREVPDLGATLVTIRGRGGRSDAATGRTADSASPGAPAAADAAKGSYFLRVLVGAAFDLLPETDHVVLGDGFDFVPLEELQPWEVGPSRSRFLEDTFGLRSLVTLDGVRIPAESAGSETTFLAVAGGKLYRIRVSGDPAADARQHRITLDVSRARSRTQDRPGIQATMLIDEGQVAVLAVPDLLLTAKQTDPAPDMVFVAVSPQFGERVGMFESLERIRIVKSPDQDAILVEGDPPAYPEALLESAPHGTVRLRAMVGEDGDVHSVAIVESPVGTDAEYLAAVAAGAVREWHYMPAQSRGVDVASWVEITLTF